MAPDRPSRPWRRCPSLLAGLLVGLSGWCLAAAQAEEPLAQRRERLEAMSPAEKGDLARRQKSFAHLTPAERQRLRELDRQLAGDEHSERLRQIMHRYYQWVITLEPYERSELTALPPAERAQRVKELLDQQTRKAAKRAPGTLPVGERTRRWLMELASLPGTANRLSEEDLKTLQRWFAQHLVRHESMIVDSLSEPQRQRVRNLLGSVQDLQRRRSILASAWLRQQLQRPPGPASLGEKELTGLSDQLTPELRSWLTGLPPPERRRVVLVWMQVAAFARVFQNPEPSIPLVDEEELARYFEEKLAAAERDRLLILPAQEMQRELLLAYARARLMEDRPRPPGRSSSKSPFSPDKRPADQGR